MRKKLGVNIDHIATLREARKVTYPNPLDSLKILETCKVDQVTLHLREDRRHIQDHDLKQITAAKILPVNLEMAVTSEMVQIALRHPTRVCTFVPEKRQEITTEGGLQVLHREKRIGKAVTELKKKGRLVSLFVDPDAKQIKAAAEVGADAVEIHTGKYCHLFEKFYLKYQTYRLNTKTELGKRIFREIKKIAENVELADFLGLDVFAGHGLHAQNLFPLVKMPTIREYNIGHAIIARAVFVGLERAVTEIQRALRN